MARPILSPEIVVTAESETEALERVCKAIANRQGKSRIVRVEVSDPNERTDDPWLPFAGMWKNDPSWEQFQADIAAFRREIE